MKLIGLYAKVGSLTEKVYLMYVHVLKNLFGNTIMSGADGKMIRQKCNQKCIDLLNKKIKKRESASTLNTDSLSLEKE